MSVSQDLGKVSVTPKGAWDADTVYAILDIVTNGGGSYLAIQAVPAGTSLLNTAYWMLIAEKGSKGDTGAAGAKGDKGDTGNGIESVERTGTVGNVDTYTITFTDGTTTTFTVTNGNVSSVNGRVGAVTGLAEKSELDELGLSMVDGKLCVRVERD